jgi:potassium-dependent mechanosensitive channel
MEPAATLTEQARETLAQFDIFSFIWNFQLFITDGGAPVTVGLLAKGLLFLSLGYFLSSWIARVVDRRVLSRTKLDAPMRSTLRKLVFYLLFFVCSLSILHLIHFPIAIFTVMGGALAIGVGFGTQNIVNNFISGIILMLDRPVKVGDIIDVDGIRGEIEEIGARSSAIRRFDNTHILVPNSKFLEQNVVNWTLADDVVRSSVKIGVAYGSDVEKVRRLLLEVAKNCPRVLPDPEPIVLFQDFGDSALIFELFVFSKLSGPMQIEGVASDLRFEMDRVCKTESISIAFPQMDVHLVSTHPLRVQQVGPI